MQTAKESLRCPSCGFEVQSSKTIDRPADTRITCAECSNATTIGACRDSFALSLLGWSPVEVPIEPARSTSVATAQATVVVKNYVIHQHNQGSEVNPGTAAILSLIFPGLGQILKGQPINGICWIFFTGACYFVNILLGIFVHICCVVGAASRGSEK